MLEQVIDQSDIHSILTEMRYNLPSNKYDVGQKVISELCSKLVEKITANHFTTKLAIPVIPGNHDVDPDCLFKFTTGDIPLEVKVAMGGKGCRWRGGGLSNRSSDYLLFTRNRESTEFFVAITHLTKNDWVTQKTQYYAPFFTEELLHARPHTVLCGSWGVESKGKRQGKPILVLEKL
jgi:hypothetical protein